MIIIERPHVSVTVQAVLRLDRPGIFRFLFRMRLLARQILRLAVVAVALGAASLNGYASVLAAFDTHAHGAHDTHSHPALDQDHDHEHGLDAGHAMHDEDPASSDQPCQHVHMHCCSSVAVAATGYNLAVADYARAIVPIADSHLPPGQLASPLFRPPRAVA
ncbi:MAG: hypothetical protein J0H65_10095 [Rhizobiales bacterium]|nr:hypothetical protein [Hyphomicrobiales bacterium]